MNKIVWISSGTTEYALTVGLRHEMLRISLGLVLDRVFGKERVG